MLKFTVQNKRARMRAAESNNTAAGNDVIDASAKEQLVPVTVAVYCTDSASESTGTLTSAPKKPPSVDSESTSVSTDTGTMSSLATSRPPEVPVRSRDSTSGSSLHDSDLGSISTEGSKNPKKNVSFDAEDTVYMIESPHDSSSGICSAEEHHSPTDPKLALSNGYHDNQRLIPAALPMSRSQQHYTTTEDEDDSDAYGFHGYHTLPAALPGYRPHLRLHSQLPSSPPPVPHKPLLRTFAACGRPPADSSQIGTNSTHVIVHHPVVHRAAEAPPNGIETLPDDVIKRIFQEFSSDQLCRIGRVCRRWHKLVYDPGLWTCIRLSGEALNADKALKVLTKRLSADTPTVCVMVEKIVLKSCAKLTDKGVYCVARHCPELRRLEFTGCEGITNISMFEVLSRCVNLEHINVSGCTGVTTLALTPEATVQATTYGKQVYVRHLDLSDCPQLEDTGLQIIVSYCTELVYLYLRRCFRVSDIGVQYVANYCPTLREFSVSDCHQVTDFGVRELSKLGANLRYLSLAKCDRVTDLGLRQLARYCHKLRYLNVRGCEGISDESLEVLATYCRKLKSADFGKCDVTDDGLIMLAESCPGLKKLSVKNCDNITDEGLTTLAYHCRGLHQLNIQDCRVSLEAYRTVKKYCKRCIIEHTNPAFY